ncbi:MAG: adenylosuccinate synthetase, partial [Candidatus Omnitrophota bacterium]
EAYFRERLANILLEKNRIFKNIYKSPSCSYQKLLITYRNYAKRLKPYITDTTLLLNDAIGKKKRLLFEGAQGTLLDIDHGTYPFVTSSNATAGGAMTGTGIGPTHIDHVIGVVKAYTTRVGEGPLPTAFSSTMMEKIREKGGEYGATTGRPRRCGWFDAVVVRHAALVNGLTSLAVTKLDVLDELSTIKVCVGYRIKGKIIRNFPANTRLLSNAKPVYEEHPGWMKPTGQSKHFKQLPKKARAYLKRISQLIRVPISIVSIGAERSRTIVL